MTDERTNDEIAAEEDVEGHKLKADAERHKILNRNPDEEDDVEGHRHGVGPERIVVDDGRHGIDP